MKTETSVQAIKAYLFPTVVSILSMMIWYDVTEIKKDLKILMAQSNIDKTRIDHLEKELDRLQDGKIRASIPIKNNNSQDNQLIVYSEFIVELPRKRWVKELHKKPNQHA